VAEITNSEAVRFCNERVRVAADKLAQLYYTAKSVSQEWTANGLGDIIAYNNGDLVVDGSASDGRHPISGIDVNNVITRLTEIVADMEANSGAKLNTVLAVAVNGVRGV
jgi:hypothetical protein